MRSLHYYQTLFAQARTVVLKDVQGGIAGTVVGCIDSPVRMRLGNERVQLFCEKSFAIDVDMRMATFLGTTSALGAVLLREKVENVNAGPPADPSGFCGSDIHVQCSLTGAS